MMILLAWFASMFLYLWVHGELQIYRKFESVPRHTAYAISTFAYFSINALLSVLFYNSPGTPGILLMLPVCLVLAFFQSGLDRIEYEMYLRRGKDQAYFIRVSTLHHCLQTMVLVFLFTIGTNLISLWGLYVQ